jgi:hypothetical protein
MVGSSSPSPDPDAGRHSENAAPALADVAPQPDPRAAGRRRRVVLLTVVGVAVVVAGAAGLTLHKNTDSGQTIRVGTAQPTRAGTPGSGGARSAEDAFLAATAVHLCNVQAAVYDDPKALAAAYNTPPSYPGLTVDQVAGFQARLRNDAAFAGRLTQQLRQSCSVGTAAGSAAPTR